MEDLLKQLTIKFNQNGYKLWVVGGYVRDSILGRATNDVDMTTDARPVETKKLLGNFGTVYDIGIEFGTVGLILNDNTHIEVTTFRKEVYPTESRKPTVVFGDNLYDDLSRRDFTINGLAKNILTNEIVDHFGGQKDIINKIIRCVGDDDTTFAEDPLRMLRAIRFACELGFSLHIKIKHPERLRIISKERIREELNRILLSDRAAYGWRRLCQTGLMYHIAPEFMDLKHIVQGKNHIKDAFSHSILVLHKSTEMDVGNKNLIFRLACIFHDLGKFETKTEDSNGVHFYGHHNIGAKKAKKILRRLRYDNETIDSVYHLILYHMTPIVLQKEVESGKVKKRSIIRLIRNVGEDNIYTLLDLVRCDIRSSKSPRHEFITKLTNLVDECMKEQPETITSPINGIEIMEEFKLEPGKMVGTIKKHLTELVIDGKLDKNDKREAFSEARKYMLKMEKTANG